METKNKCCECKEFKSITEYTFNPRKPKQMLKTCISCLNEIQQQREFKKQKIKQDYLDCCKKNNIIPKRDTYFSESKPPKCIV